MNKNKFILILISIIILTSICIIIYKNENSYSTYTASNVFTNENTNNLGDTISSTKSTPSKLKVHIIGEIVSPGIYELNEGDRIYDLILLAGGTTENADLNKINLAYELSDGEKIYIPGISDEISTYIYNDAGENVSDRSSISSNNKKININQATTSDLEKISGIGPSLAEKIINYRNSNGKFNSIDELKNISGIGDKKFEIIQEYIDIK